MGNHLGSSYTSLSEAGQKKKKRNKQEIPRFFLNAAKPLRDHRIHLLIRGSALINVHSCAVFSEDLSTHIRQERTEQLKASVLRFGIIYYFHLQAKTT